MKEYNATIEKIDDLITVVQGWKVETDEVLNDIKSIKKIDEQMKRKLEAIERRIENNEAQITGLLETTQALNENIIALAMK